MVMMLVLSFAAFTALKFVETKLETTVEETPWQVFQRKCFGMISALAATLINQGL